MLQLYFYPMACSLSSRIALMEAGIEARYRPAHIWKKTVLDDDSNFLAVSSKGAVPVLVLENGERLTEAAAVLQYIADLRPEARLAPPPGDLDRYRLQEWLSFVGTEIHKAFCFRPSGTRTTHRRRARANASGRAYRWRPRIYRTATISSATASPWQTPISPGHCCCSAAPASISGNGPSLSPIATVSRRVGRSRRLSRSRWRYARRSLRDRKAPSQMTSQSLVCETRLPDGQITSDLQN